MRVVLGVFVEFLWLGVEHIAIGYDHILFLLALLLAMPGFAGSVRLITCFTVAHSLTLALSIFGVLQLPGLVVESVIAASVVWAALLNLRGAPEKYRLATTFGFGLIHGFGFASVLRELEIGSHGGVVLPLLSFNLGVEVGQVLITSIAVPLLWLLSRPGFRFRGAIVPLGSVVIACCGLYWLVARIVGG